MAASPLHRPPTPTGPDESPPPAWTLTRGASFTADGAYDQDGVSASVAKRHPEAAVIVPPRVTAVPSDTAEAASTQRAAIFSSSPSTGAWRGGKRPDTPPGPEPRPPSAGSSA